MCSFLNRLVRSFEDILYDLRGRNNHQPGRRVVVSPDHLINEGGFEIASDRNGFAAGAADAETV